MRKRVTTGGLMVAVLCCVAPLRADPVADLVGNVSQSSFQNYLDNHQFTRLGNNRGYGPEHYSAQTNIFAQFAQLGLQTWYHPFQYGGSGYSNVVAVLPGTTARSNEIYIVGAHYDSVNNPGADDNASGVAGVLEAARVLSQYRFEATLRFIAFDREEQGLRGSNAYAGDHAGENIQGMISLDMIAYNHNGSNRARIFGRSSSDPLKIALSNSIALYGEGLSAVLQGQFDASDHAPFEWRGFQAALLIEYGYANNPHYHKATDSVDTPGYIDYAYATRMTRSTVGYLATVAGLIPIPETHTALLAAVLSIGLVRGGRARPQGKAPGASPTCRS